MKKFFVTLFLGALCIGIVNAASKTTDCDDAEGTSTVLSMREHLPIETPATGKIISIEAPDAPLKVTTDMGNVPEQNMKAFAEKPELFKSAIMGNFPVMGDRLLRLAVAAYNAGIPFSIHIVSTSFPKGFTITFSVEELKEGLTEKK